MSDIEQALDFKCACPGGGLSLLVPLSVKVLSDHCLLFFFLADIQCFGRDCYPAVFGINTVLIIMATCKLPESLNVISLRLR